MCALSLAPLESVELEPVGPDRTPNCSPISSCDSPPPRTLTPKPTLLASLVGDVVTITGNKDDDDATDHESDSDTEEEEDDEDEEAGEEEEEAQEEEDSDDDVPLSTLRRTPPMVGKKRSPLARTLKPKKAIKKAPRKGLLLCDNLGSQTKKVNPAFSTILKRKARVKAWNLPPECTDAVQVIDAGVGALTKSEAGDIQEEWLRNDANFAEWKGNMTVGRKRILLTQWYGEAWERVCRQFDFRKVFRNTGMSLGCNDDGSSMKLQGMRAGEFTFESKDLHRDAKTFELPAVEPPTPPLDQVGEQEAQEASEESEYELSIHSDGGDTTDEDLDSGGISDEALTLTATPHN
jgi:hypothetical protein